MGIPADGHVIIKTAADNSQLEKDLAAATKKIDSMEKKLAGKRTDRNQIAEQLKTANQEAIDAYNNVERLKKSLAKSQAITSVSGPNVGPFRYTEEIERQKQIKEELKEQEKVLKQKEKVAERLAKKDAEAVAKLEDQTAELNRQKASAGEIYEQLQKNQSLRPLDNMMVGVEKRVDKIGKRISGLAKRVLIFSVLTSALRGVRSWLWNVISANDEASDAFGRLEGALLTLAQPLLEVVIPAFTAFVNILTRVVSAIASLFSMMSGKTIDQSKKAAEGLKKETDALNATGSAAKKASKSLAAFDEINQLSGSDSAGAGTSVSGISPDFSFDTSGAETDLEKLLKWIELIGAALLAWKFSDNLRDGMKTFLGLVLAINGAIELGKGTLDAWQNGVDWDNFLQMLEGAALLVSGLGVAFGPVGAAIGLIVSGLDLLATGFRDAMENGWNLQNMLMSISGIMATGIGIGILTGSFIPALIAGIASVLLALAVATGHGEELLDGLRKICEGFLEFITGIFSGDIEKALGGIEKMFDGLGIAVGAVIDGVKDTFLSFLDWLDEKTGGKLHGIIEVAKGFVAGFFDSVKNTALNVVDSAKQIFIGLVQFVAGVFTNDWDMAWEGVKNVFKGVWNGIVSLLEDAVNLIIQGVNWLIEKLNTIHFEVPDWVPGIGGKSWGISIEPLQSIQIPRLATGAVIPPNREFLAVLGDQKSGTNIEAPLSTIEQALENVIRRRGYAGEKEITIILELDHNQVAKAVYTLNKEESRRVGTSLTVR